MEFERVVCRCDGSFWDSGGREWRRGGIGVAVALGVMAGSLMNMFIMIHSSIAMIHAQRAYKVRILGYDFLCW